MSKILVVCTANVSRSPVIEAVFRQYLRSDITSAACQRFSRTGQPCAIPMAIRALRDMGYTSPDTRCSRLVTAEDIHGSDLIVIAEPVHLDALVGYSGITRHDFYATIRPRVYTLMRLLTGISGLPLADPYHAESEQQQYVMYQNLIAVTSVVASHLRKAGW